jgi:hypothetical protein
VNNTGTKKVALWNKWHFEEKNEECAACLKYSVLIFVEKTSGRRLEWQRQMEKEDTISVQWAQEDVESLYNLLNNNNNI